MSAPTNHTPAKIKSVAVVGNYLPRKCGIATFTKDLVESLLNHGNCQCKAVAINDRPEGYDYPQEVRFEINQNKRADYRTAAEFLNINHVDIVSLQHEFGIFGGQAGDYILTLLDEIKIPVITTLHTILVDPTRKQEHVMERLIELSEKLVVMSQSAVNILHTLYEIPEEKIVFIPHGIPDVPFVDPNYYKEKFDLMGRKVLLTFGLLSENKGIEYVIRGLPSVVEKLPDITYIVLGATHPKVLESKGEKYRRKLEQLVKKLNLGDHVIFRNHFVPFEELCEYLAAADIYITPYTKEEQITSGTLAYASGTGKAVISTPYWYAKEMLSNGRGRLVPFKDADAIAEAITGLFENDAERHQMRKRAYDFNRNATWKEVAGQYLEVFQKVKSNLHHNPREKASFLYNSVASPLVKQGVSELPAFNIDHLLSLTDDTGLLQHAAYTISNRNHGYCTDDNARGLLFAVQARQIPQITEDKAKQLDILSKRYLSFLFHAFNTETGRFRNFMSYSREWEESTGSKDSHGRALWALGVTASLSTDGLSHLPLSSTLFMRALDAAESFDSPRAIAFALIGIDAYLEFFSGDSKARRIGITLAERLFNKFNHHARDSWPWFEDSLTYSNGKLSHALILAGKRMQRDDMTKMGIKSLEWLLEVQTERDHLSIIGNQGWFTRNGYKARFDQQPLEAHNLLEACIAAYEVSAEELWLNRARTCFNWFLGHNDLKLPLYNENTGGCRDGLESNKVNLNEGAESTLAWLLSLTAMYRLSELSEDEIPRFSSKTKSYLRNK